MRRALAAMPAHVAPLLLQLAGTMADAGDFRAHAPPGWVWYVHAEQKGRRTVTRSRRVRLETLPARGPLPAALIRADDAQSRGKGEFLVVICYDPAREGPLFFGSISLRPPAVAARPQA